MVTAFLEQFFARYVEYDFTAALEEKLDLVSAGDLNWKALLREFWTGFHAAVGDIGELRMGDVLTALDIALAPHIFPDAKRRRRSHDHVRRAGPAGSRSRPASLAPSSAVPTTRNAASRGPSPAARARTARPAGDRELGVDPATGHTIWLKLGRFGPYVEEVAETPKRASLPKDWPPPSLDLDKALAAVAPAARDRNAPRGRRKNPRRESAGTVPTSSTTGPTPIWPAPRRCSRSASTGPSLCSRRSGRAGAAGAGRHRRPS